MSWGRAFGVRLPKAGEGVPPAAPGPLPATAPGARGRRKHAPKRKRVIVHSRLLSKKRLRRAVPAEPEGDTSTGEEDNRLESTYKTLANIRVDARSYEHGGPGQ